MTFNQDCHIEAIRAFTERVANRAMIEMAENPKKIDAAHMRAIMREKEAAEAEWLKGAPERARALKEAKAKADQERRRLEDLERKESKWLDTNAALKIANEKLSNAQLAIELERIELSKQRDELIAREMLIDTERRRSFEAQLSKPLDLIQIDPEYLTRPELRGCIGVVIEVKPDGAVKVYVQGIGKDGLIGDVTFAIIPDKWCKKVGIANWHWSPALR